MGSFVGGAALGVVAAISLVFGTLGFKWLTNPLVYIGNIYRLIFGVVICVLDGPTDSHPNMQRTILTYASFMQNNFSRSAFYLFIACMEHPEKGWWHTAVAYYFLFIGAVHFFAQVTGAGTSSSTPPVNLSRNAGAAESW